MIWSWRVDIKVEKCEVDSKLLMADPRGWEQEERAQAKIMLILTEQWRNSLLGQRIANQVEKTCLQSCGSHWARKPNADTYVIQKT